MQRRERVRLKVGDLEGSAVAQVQQQFYFCGFCSQNHPSESCLKVVNVEARRRVYKKDVVIVVSRRIMSVESADRVDVLVVVSITLVYANRGRIMTVVVEVREILGVSHLILKQILSNLQPYL